VLTPPKEPTRNGPDESASQEPASVSPGTDPDASSTHGDPSTAFDPRIAANRRWIWVLRIVLGLALLIGFKLAFDFLSQYRYTDTIPRASRWPSMLRRSTSRWDWSQLPGYFHGNYFRTRLVPRARVLVFVVGVWGCLFWAGAIVVYEYLLLFRPLSNGSARRNRFAPYVWLRRLVLTVSGVGVLCILYGFYVEPNWLEVTHVGVESEKLPHGALPIRLVVISDLHMDRNPRLEPKLPEVIAAEKPDLIVFLGDAMNSSWALGRFKQLMLTLHNIAPVVAVRGNQDQGYWEGRDFYSGTQVTDLQAQSAVMRIRGVELYIWGQAYDPPRLIPPDPPPAPGAFTVLLQHSPDLIADAVRAHFDLYLAGHTHGGQVALPFVGALITYSRYDKKYEAGLYREGSTTLYVNRGIGLAKWPQPQARFFARPEVTVIDLAGR
jgi:uncharacterized protein